jgi:serine protease Do
VITLNSTSELDPFLRVLDANGNEVATDDDGGGGLNSRINRFFPAGTYRIEATSFGDGETGSYVLSLIRL